MSSPPTYDAVVLGGGIMGCSTALGLAEAGMRVAVIERGRLCAAASGVNAGTLSLQIKRAALIPYALRGWEMWRTMSERLGIDVGFHVRGGLTVAFTDEEAEVLRVRMSERRAAGAPIEMVDAREARRIEPALSSSVVLASHCAKDGYSNASLTGRAFRAALTRAGVDVREATEADRVERGGAGWTVRAGGEKLGGRRLIMAAGAWLGRLAGLAGLSLPLRVRVNQVAVTERSSSVFRAIVGHALGVLTLKQSDNGTILIGGGWQGEGGPEAPSTDVVVANLIGNLRLARYAIPGLAVSRLVRVWHGLEAHVPDSMPLVGAVGSGDDLFVIGCVRGGYTIGPYMGRLLADRILGRQPEMPLFDPARFDAAAAAAI